LLQVTLNFYENRPTENVELENIRPDLLAVKHFVVYYADHRD